MMKSHRTHLLFALLSFTTTSTMADTGQLTPPDLTPTIIVYPAPVPSKPVEPATLAPEKKTTLVGTLKNDRIAIAGETTGWTLHYRDEAGVQVIEVDLRDLKAKARDGTTMRVTGNIVVREYVERGNIRTLLVSKLEEVANR